MFGKRESEPGAVATSKSVLGGTGEPVCDPPLGLRICRPLTQAVLTA